MAWHYESTGRFTIELRRLVRASYNQCSRCGRALQYGEPAYAGYGHVGQALYAGECCSTHFREVASPIYWYWTRDKRCNPNTRLWRYIDFAKFVMMLSHRSLYFSRADLLGDKFEGASGRLDRKGDFDKFYLDFFREALLTLPGGVPPSTDPEEAAKSSLEALSRHAKEQQMRTFVSCWHANVGESEALWRLYCPEPSAGVALSTTAGKLCDALDEVNFNIGHVQYIDFKQAFPGPHDRLFWKRLSLAHENEVRATIEDYSVSTTGLNVAVNLSQLIDVVVPSPFGPPWLDQLIRSTCAQFGWSLNVEQSDLRVEPFF